LPAKLRQRLPAVKDSGGIMADESASLRLNRKSIALRRGDGRIDPLFDESDADAAGQFRFHRS
jgi:hypothetical protein